MHIYNKIHVLLSTLSYVFRHLQVELYRTLKITVTLFGCKPMYITNNVTIVLSIRSSSPWRWCNT